MAIKDTDADAASPDEEKGKQAKANVEASQNSDEKADEKQEVTIGESSESQEEPQKEAPEKEELDKKALAEKVSVLEKRYSERDKEYEVMQKQQAAILESMNPIFQKNKEAYEEWRQQVIQKGIADPGSHEQLYGTTEQQSSSPAPTQQPSQPYDTSQVVSTIDQRIEDREGWKSFIKGHPEFDPKNIPESEREERSRQWQSISLLAAGYKADPRYSHLTSGQLFEYGWRALPENQDKSTKEAEKVGEIKGRQGVLIEGVGSDSGVSGGSSSQLSGGKVQMNKTQFATYERLKKEHPDNPKIAEQYARNVQSLQ